MPLTLKAFCASVGRPSSKGNLEEATMRRTVKAG